MSILKQIIKINTEDSYEDVFEKELSINREIVVGDDTEIVDSLENEKASQKFLYEISGENKTRSTVILFSLLKMSIIILILTIISTAFYVNSLQNESTDNISNISDITYDTKAKPPSNKDVKDDSISVTKETEVLEIKNAGSASENETLGPTNDFLQLMNDFNSEFVRIYKGFNSLSDEYISGNISLSQYKKYLSEILPEIDQNLKTLEDFESRASQNIYYLGIYNSVYSRYSNIYNNILRMDNTIFDIEIKEILKKARRTDIKYTTYLNNFF